MIFMTGDLVRLDWSDHPDNIEIVGKDVRVVRQDSLESPYWITVVDQDVLYLVRGYDCVKLSTVVAGIDEVGRGAFAGPLVIVCAAFKIDAPWDPEAVPCPVAGVKDSKKYPNHKKRSVVARALSTCPDMVAAGLGQVEPEEINKHGLAWAMKVATEMAVQGVTSKVRPDLILMDGYEKAESWPGPQMAIPKADNLWWPVSAASVLAKVYRDQLMIELHSKYPGYGFNSNKGYGTSDHVLALRKHGPCPIHRTQFIRSSLEDL